MLVRRDSNDQLLILASASTRAEDGGSAAWFVSFCREAYPTLAIVMHDQGTAFLGLFSASLRGLTPDIIAAAHVLHVEAVENLMSVLCTRHLAPHIVSQHPKVEGVSDLVWKLARARTEVAVTECLSEARALSEGLCGELNEIKELISLFYRIRAGLMSRGTLTSNNAEAELGAVVLLRNLGPLSLIQGLLEIAQQGNFVLFSGLFPYKQLQNAVAVRLKQPPVVLMFLLQLQKR